MLVKKIIGIPGWPKTKRPRDPVAQPFHKAKTADAPMPRMPIVIPWSTSHAFLHIEQVGMLGLHQDGMPAFTEV